ncbi:MAG TPA: ion transporter [Luteolibacter sp.]|nr:ion transporter [Luteolibacter sp.]
MIASSCLRLTESAAFRRFIIGVILLAAVVVGLETDRGLMERHGGLLHALDRTILGIFVLEILLKLAAKAPRPWHYFRDPWNVFDFAIVAVCLLPMHAEFAAVLRLARVLRVLRLVTSLPKLQLLVGALLKSIPSMGYVGVLLSLLFYIYAVSGVFFFGQANPEYFGSLGRALLTLAGVITLEGWTDLMYGLLDPEVAVSKVKVIAYFLSFVLFGTMIMLNLFIGVIMNSMQEMQEEKEAALSSGTGPAADIARIEHQLGELHASLSALKSKL